MPTFSNGEALSGVRSKINTAITNIDNMRRRQFATRQNFVTEVSGGWTPDVGQVVQVGSIAWAYDGVATAIADLPGWKATGQIYWQHFQDNTTPGTTDLSAGVLAALTYCDDLSARYSGPDGTVMIKSHRGERIAISQSIDMNGFSGVRVAQTTVIAIGAWGGGGPMFSVQKDGADKAERIIFQECHFEGGHIADGFVLFDDTLHQCEVVDCTGHGPTTYGVRATTKNAALTIRNNRFNQYNFGETGWDVYANRTATLIDVQTTDSRVLYNTAFYCLLPMSCTGYLMQVIGNHPFNDGVASGAPAEGMDCAEFDINAGVVQSNYFDNGTVKWNAGRGFASGEGSITFCNNIFFKNSSGDNTHALRLVAPDGRTGLDLSELILANNSFQAEGTTFTAEVETTTEGTGTFASALLYTVDNNLRDNGNGYARGIPVTQKGSLQALYQTGLFEVGPFATNASGDVFIGYGLRSDSGSVGRLSRSTDTLIFAGNKSTGFDTFNALTFDPSNRRWQVGDLSYGRMLIEGFADRSEMVSWWTAAGTEGFTPSVGTIMRAGPLSYVYTGVTTWMSDMQGWEPSGVTHPDHFVENTDPGTTDMSAAIQAAIDYEASRVGTSLGADNGPALTIKFFPDAYFVGATLSWPSSYGRVHLVGNGAIVLASHAGAIFRAGDDDVFDAADCAGTSTHYGFTVSGFTFRNSDGTLVGSKAIEVGKGWDVRIFDNQFWNFDVAIDLVTCGHSFVVRNIFKTRTRTTVNTTAFIHLRGVYDSSVDKSTGAGIWLLDNDMSGLTNTGVANYYDKTLAGVLINSCDTVYFGDNHISFCKNAVRINMLGSADNYANNNFSDFLSYGGNYFDDAGTGANFLVDGTVCYDDTNTRDRGFVGRIVFDKSDKFRGASRATNGVSVNVIDGSITPGDYFANRGPIDISVSGQFAQHTAQHISYQGPNTAGTARISVSSRNTEITSWDNRTSGASIVYSAGGSHSVDGVKVLKEGTAPTQLFSFNMLPTTGEVCSVSIKNVDAKNSTYTNNTPYTLSNIRGQHVEVDGVVYNDAGGVNKRARDRYVVSSGEEMVIADYFDMPATKSALIVEAKFVGDASSASAAGDRYVLAKQSLRTRRDGGTTTLVGYTDELMEKSTGWASNTFPALLTLMTGAAWTASTAYEGGDVVVNGGNVYVVVFPVKGAPVVGGTTAPTHTSGFWTDTGVTYAYIGAENVNRVSAVVGAEASLEIEWAVSVEMFGV